MKIAVIGGGISGLSAAYRLRRAGIEATILEESPRAGGKIYSERTDGFLVEHGPNGFLDSREAVVRLARDVGLGQEMLPADPRAKHRFLFLDGQLQKLPDGPPAFLASPILSLGGRLRLLREYFVSQRTTESDESVFDFAARRVGVEAAERLIDPMVTGIYAGDVRQLSLPAAFPRLAQLEREFGGLVKGMLALKRQRKAQGGPGGPGGRLTSFGGGLSNLVEAVQKSLDQGTLQTERPVHRIEALQDHRWAVHAKGGEPLQVDGIVFTTPTSVTARLLGEVLPAAVTPLEEIKYAPAAVLGLGYPEELLRGALDGFGFLVPSGEKRDLLGVLWSSTLFAHRAPDGQVLLRCIMGGAHRPELVDLDDETLMDTATRELSIAFGRDLSQPTFQRVIRWPQGIPQYTLGHLQRVRVATEAAQTKPGLFLAGNGLVGVSLADCIGHAESLPQSIRDRL